MPYPHVFRLDNLFRHILGDAVCTWYGRKWVGTCWEWTLYNQARVKWGCALIICYNKPGWLCRLWPGGARSGSIKLIKVYWFGQKWVENEYFSTGRNGVCALIICYNKPGWVCRLWPGGACSGLIKSIQAFCLKPTVLGLVGNEWEPTENECFSTGQNGGCALIICYNKPVWLCRLWPVGARSGSIQSIQACSW